MTKSRPSSTKTSTRYGHRFHPAILALILPLSIGILTLAIIASGLYYHSFASLGSKRLETENWQYAQQSLLHTQPSYERKYAYYEVREGQTPEDVAAFFSVNLTKLTTMNPRGISPGSIIKIPPVEAPFRPTSGPNNNLDHATVSEDNGVVRVRQKFTAIHQPIITNLPELTALLAPYNAIAQLGPTSYRINRPISIEGDIRTDLTKATVTHLELRSTHNEITCLCFDEGTALISGVTITSYDPDTGKPDTDSHDGRSFVRMKNGRMDIMNSTLSYLGNGLDHESPTSPFYATLKDGGVYGASWRIASNQFGHQIATGWVENNTFSHNYFGSYSFGASGMVWRKNVFANNEVYGLDPHDDSNNALIEDNIFKYNGKHGFIVSKRCNYNIIRNNTSIGNTLNGFMLHQESAYNLLENNVSMGNTDNFVIYASDFNTLRGNKSYWPLSSNIRVNASSHNNFLTGNQLFKGTRGVYIYGDTTNTYIGGNTIQGSKRKLQTIGTTNTVVVNNTIENVRYEIAGDDRIIFGPNTIKSVKPGKIDAAAILAVAERRRT